MLRVVRNLFYRVSLGDPAYRFLFEPGPAGEVVVIDCETTGLNPRRDNVIAVAAIQVRHHRIITSGAYQAVVRSDRTSSEASMKVHGLRNKEVAEGRGMHEVLPELLRFIGGRPIVGYYTDFDVAMLDKHVLPFIEAKLPNRRIDVSALYYDLKYRGAPPGTVYDLRFTTILQDLGLPTLLQHNALDDALMTAMMYVQLQDMHERGVRIGRTRQVQHLYPTGA